MFVMSKLIQNVTVLAKIIPKIRMDKLKYRIEHFMNKVLSKEKAEIVLNLFAKRFSRQTFYRYKDATFNEEKPEREKLVRSNTEALLFLKEEFGLKTIEDLFTEEYAAYLEKTKSRIEDVLNDVETEIAKII